MYLDIGGELLPVKIQKQSMFHLDGREIIRLLIYARTDGGQEHHRRIVGVLERARRMGLTVLDEFGVFSGSWRVVDTPVFYMLDDEGDSFDHIFELTDDGEGRSGIMPVKMKVAEL